MSKQRPSSAAARPVTPARASAVTPIPGVDWQKRVFKNTYTRDGRCIEVRSWSVKIQHQGTRRTFSLTARNRSPAAIEAQAIYQTILTQGWDAAVSVARNAVISRRSRAPTETESPPKTEVRYWRHRLLRRAHSSSANLTATGEFSARIEHAGASHYFPLGTSNDETAAARAREIYLTVVRDGWELAKRFRRELTVAVHWADNPLAWTYATFHTTINIDPRSPSSVPAWSSRPVNVALVESDSGARLALSQCVNRQGGFVCSGAFQSGKEALREIPRSSPNLALVSRALPDVAPEDFTERLRRIAPHLPVLFFNLYEDSDHLFKATPGGASGYLLKRTPPDRLFEPIAEAPGAEPLSRERIAQRVRRYFHDVIVSLSADDPTREMAKLTHREHDILNLLSKGYVDKEIAEALRISVWTVHGHLKKVFEKLGVHTRTEAAVKYLHK